MALQNGDLVDAGRSERLDEAILLSVISDVRGGDLSARMPDHHYGTGGVMMR